jgi:hypothetical protein
MPEQLKRILDAKRLQLDTFYEAVDGRIIEKLDDGTEAPTRYYLDSNGVYMEEEEYIEKLKEKEHKKRQEYLARQQQLKEKSKEQLKEFENESAQSTKDISNRNIGVLRIVGLVLLVLAIVAVGYYYWPNGNTPEEYGEKVSSLAITEEEPLPFGNAVITGNEVNFRAGPTTDTLIIGVFPEIGERIQILKEKNLKGLWYQVKRKDSTVGWVYGTYVEMIDTDSIPR